MKKVKCAICSKEVQVEKFNVNFYANWTEYEPEKWVCRKCKENSIWPNIIQFKLPDSYRRQE